ncbi:MAG: glycosyltransferase family 2 protein [Myxococcota bacterium]
MRVSVSIVTHQSANQIDACLAGVRKQGSIVDEVFVVDSGSTDGTIERLRERHPYVSLDAVGSNVGYAGGHNRNFLCARGDAFLVLNPDVVLGAGHVATLCGALDEDPRRGAAGGRLLHAHAPERIDSAGIGYDRWYTRFVDRGRGLPASQYRRDEDVWGTCGAATLYRSEALASVSGPEESPFAERLFMYYEDVDLAWRLRRAGWQSRFCADATALHARGGSGASVPFSEYYLVRNRLWVSLRNASRGELLRELPGLLGFELVKAVQALGRPHLRRALFDQCRGIPAALQARHRLAKGAV